MSAIDKRNVIIAFASFLLATIITYYFIYCGADVYHFDHQKMLLSCTIAGGKWGLQILGAIMFLKEQRWVFIRNISLTCLVGSVVLLPFCFRPDLSMFSGVTFFH